MFDAELISHTPGWMDCHEGLQEKQKRRAHSFFKTHTTTNTYIHAHTHMHTCTHAHINTRTHNIVSGFYPHANGVTVVKHCRNLLRAAFITRVHKARGAFIHGVNKPSQVVACQRLRNQIPFHTEKRAPNWAIMATNALIGFPTEKMLSVQKVFVRSISISIMHENCFYKFDMRSLDHAAQTVAICLTNPKSKSFVPS